MSWPPPLVIALLAALTSSGGAHRDRLVPAPVDHPAPRVRCERPRSLHLRRFEDRSARLECGGRVIARVEVPG